MQTFLPCLSSCLPSHQAQKCQQAKLTGIGIGREKRFWRFVIDKSATVEARAQDQNTAQSRRRGRLPKCEQAFRRIKSKGCCWLSL